MAVTEQKQLARQRRERKLRMWLTTLSWSMPVVAFGGFFATWHELGTATSPTASHVPVIKQTNVVVEKKAMFQVGTQSAYVSAIQRQLTLLGYFHHPITQYYGEVTAQAVKSFQRSQGLPVNGEVDNTTLIQLQQAVKEHRTASISDPVRLSTSPVKTSPAMHKTPVATLHTVTTHHATTTSHPTHKVVAPPKPVVQSTPSTQVSVSQQSTSTATTGAS